VAKKIIAAAMMPNSRIIGSGVWMYRMMLRTTTIMTMAVTIEAFWDFLARASRFWAATISLPFPAGTVRMRGSFGSSGL